MVPTNKLSDHMEAYLKQYLKDSDTYGDRERHEIGKAARLFYKLGENAGTTAEVERAKRQHTFYLKILTEVGDRHEVAQARIKELEDKLAKNN